MIRKITLQNFMSHRHTVIEPASGLTVLVGDNNCGKSAVVAALQILCHNTSGDYMVRHGENECKIIVETDEGHIVEWKRKGGTVSYTLDGKAIHRLRGGIPDDLHKLLRIPMVFPQDGGDPFDIHFGEQKKPIFLLDEPGSRAAKFFASSSDAEVLIRMQILHKKNVRNAIQRSAKLQEELDTINRRLDPLEAVADIQRRLDGLEDQHSTLMANREIVVALYQDIESFSKITEQVHRFEDGTRVLTRLRTPPPMVDTDSLGDLVTGLDAWLKRFSLFEHQKQTLDDLQVPPRLADTETLEELTQNIAQAGLSVQNQSEKVGCFAQLDSPPELFDVGSLNGLIEQIETTSTKTLRSMEQVEALGRCKAPPSLHDESALIDLIDKLERIGASVAMHSSACDVLHTLRNPPSLIDLNALETIIADSEALQKDVRKRKEKLDRATSRAADAEKALRDWATENRICPTCGAELDPDRLVTMAITTSGGHKHE